MNSRRTMKARGALTVVAITTGLALTLAGCGGGGEDDKPTKPSTSAPSADRDEKGDSAAPPADHKLAEVEGNGITLSVSSAVRDEGGFLTISGTVRNGTGAPWLAGEWKSDESELSKSAGSMAGASLVDSKEKKKYLILRDTSGRCLCTLFEGGVDPDETTEWFAQFPAPPEGTTKVQLQLPTMPPADIEITGGE